MIGKLYTIDIVLFKEVM